MIKKNLIIFMPFIGGGGVEKNLFIISDYLCKKFKNIKVCTLSKDKKNKFNKKIKFLEPKNNFSSQLNIRLKYLVCLFILFKYLIRNKNSVVFSFQANIYCILICKILNIKIIVRSNSSPEGWYHNFFKKIIYKLIISKADDVIVNSEIFKKQMKEKFDINVKCIFNPLNFKEILKKSKSKNKKKFFKKHKNCLKLINLGRFTEQKDQITILKAAKILSKNINFQLLIFGRGVEEHKLKNFIYQNNLEKYVEIKNFTNNPYLAINESDVFILSSKYEGLPNVLLEAAVLKKYIISTNCPTGPSEILLNGKGGLFFKIGDYNDLAKKIIYLVKNKNILKKKKEYLFKNLKKYDLNKNLNMYYLLIKKYI